MDILIKNVQLEGNTVDVLIEGNRFSEIRGRTSEVGILAGDDCRIIDGTDKAIVPSFVNAHTHASMTLLRGYADDLELHDWLTNYIWPLEAKMTEEDIYHGARLACLEMIKSGTTCFNDMYWHFHGTARAVEEAGIRAVLSSVFIDFNDEERAATERRVAARLYGESKHYSDRIGFALGPHAIYTVSEESLMWAKAFAEEHGLKIHIHLSETVKEVEDCIEAHGARPVEWLSRIGFLGPEVIAAHVIHVNDDEIELLSQHSVKVVHNPVSNMKLVSGRFPYQLLKNAGVHVSLGTDGCSSNNNLCMLEEMKIAALHAKLSHESPTVMTAQDVYDMATYEGAEALGIDSGKVEEGKLADCLLVDLLNPRLAPGYLLTDDLVYSADSSCIDTVICDGKILMENGIVPNEREIVEEAREYGRRFAR
jgi:5-methylthioadenosine/S-adenosylhomocysteine deaminase